MDKPICLKIYQNNWTEKVHARFPIGKKDTDSYYYKIPKIKVHNGNADQLFTSPMLARHINALRHTVKI